VDVLAGTNLDEWRLWLWMDPSSFEMTEERMTDDLRLFFGDHAPLAAATYRQRLGDVEPAFVFAAGRTDAIFRVPLLRCVDAHVAAGGRAHQYLFTYGSRRRKETLGAMHAIEIPFVFDTLGAPGGTFLTGAEPPESLAKEMSGTWVAFARGGDPSAGLFGAWPPYTLDLRTTMVIGATSRTEDDPLADERRLLMGT
jgi:carboxylesterase type B